MIFEFSLLGAAIGLSWALSVPLSGMLIVALGVVLFFSKSIPVNILILLTVQFLALMHAILGSKKVGNAGTEKRYIVGIFGLFLALFGASMEAYSWSILAIFFGILFYLSNGITLFFFNRHYDRLTLSSYLQSSLIPGLIALDILLKIKPEVKLEYSQLWDITLIGLGLFGCIHSSVLALTQKRLRHILMHLAQSWLGIGLFLLMFDSESRERLALSAISIGVVSNLVLLNYAYQLGRQYWAFAKAALIGFPGLISFMMILLSFKMTIGLNVLWLLPLVGTLALQAITLVRMRCSTVINQSNQIKIKFWISVIVQMASGVGIYWIEMGGLK